MGIEIQLSKNEQLVMGILQNENKPMTVNEISSKTGGVFLSDYEIYTILYKLTDDYKLVKADRRLRACEERRGGC